MKLLEPGTLLDGFVIDECIHSGGMAHIYSVRYANAARTPDFPMVMKVPRMTADDGAENIVSFEVEHQLMQVLNGPHVPRFVAAGDLQNLPYLVMEYVAGKTLDHWLPQSDASSPPPFTGSIGPAWRGNGTSRTQLAQTERMPPGSQTGQRDDQNRWWRSAARLWSLLPRALPRPAGRRIEKSSGLARLDCTRTGGGRARRSAQRYFCNRSHALRAGHG